MNDSPLIFVYKVLGRLFAVQIQNLLPCMCSRVRAKHFVLLNLDAPPERKMQNIFTLIENNK